MNIPAFAPEEITSAGTTRASRLKWVIVVDPTIAIGYLANAVACISASIGEAVDGLIGPTATDATGVVHAGLPWPGCTVLQASREQIEAIRARAVAHDEMFVSDMPLSAQRSRAYDDYRVELAGRIDTETIAIGIVGPRNAVDRLVKRLALLA